MTCQFAMAIPAEGPDQAATATGVIEYLARRHESVWERFVPRSEQFPRSGVRELAQLPSESPGKLHIDQNFHAVSGSALFT